MYIDYREFTGDLSDEEAARDTEYTKRSFSKWFDTHLDEIVDRSRDIKDIGIIERVGNFIKLVREAETTYTLGAFQSTIALIGVAAEDFCRYLCNEFGFDSEKLNQNSRLIEMKARNILNPTGFEDLNRIRQLRNDCLHYNSKFSSKSTDELKTNALDSINTLKKVYQELLGVSDKSIKINLFSAAFDQIGNETAQDGSILSNSEDGLKRFRNILFDLTGINISLDKGGSEYRTLGIFRVDEVDLQTNPPEATLVDLRIGSSVIVDFSPEDLTIMDPTQLNEGDIVIAGLKSVTNRLGATTAWEFVVLPTKI